MNTVCRFNLKKSLSRSPWPQVLDLSSEIIFRIFGVPSLAHLSKRVRNSISMSLCPSLDSSTNSFKRTSLITAIPMALSFSFGIQDTCAFTIS